MVAGTMRACGGTRGGGVPHSGRRTAGAVAGRRVKHAVRARVGGRKAVVGGVARVEQRVTGGRTEAVVAACAVSATTGLAFGGGVQNGGRERRLVVQGRFVRRRTRNEKI